MKLLWRLFRVDHYFEYFLDVCYSKVNLFLLRKAKNFIYGKSLKIRGIPIISMVKGSSIKIGQNAYLISRPRNTALGVHHPVIIRTLTAESNLTIGNQFSASGATICCANKIEIGNRVMLGANVTITDTDFHSMKSKFRFSGNDLENALSLPIYIEDDVFIGMNAIILKGIRIGRGAVIGAGSIVTKDVKEWTMVAGNPAKFIKEIK